ncbi:MAG: hypothetical protein Q9164_006685, partial [Protoblastenia rupestris]
MGGKQAEESRKKALKEVKELRDSLSIHYEPTASSPLRSRRPPERDQQPFDLVHRRRGHPLQKRAYRQSSGLHSVTEDSDSEFTESGISPTVTARSPSDDLLEVYTTNAQRQVLALNDSLSAHDKPLSPAKIRGGRLSTLPLSPLKTQMNPKPTLGSLSSSRWIRQSSGSSSSNSASASSTHTIVAKKPARPSRSKPARSRQTGRVVSRSSIHDDKSSLLQVSRSFERNLVNQHTSFHSVLSSVLRLYFNATSTDHLLSLQEESFLTRPAIKLTIPDHLKSILVDDWEYVTKNLSLVPLPSPHPVNSILDTYFDEEKGKRRLGSPEADLLEEVVMGMKDYFEACLGRILLYRFERQQYLNVKKDMDKGVEEFEGKKGMGD